MKELGWLAGVLALSLVVSGRAAGEQAPRVPTPAPTGAAVSGLDDRAVKQVVGIYRSTVDSTEVWIASLGKGALQLAVGRARHAVGFWDGRRFRGVWRPTLEFSESPGAEAYGEIRFEVVAPETIRAEIWHPGRARPSVEIWVRADRLEALDETAPPSRDPGNPKPGDYVYVEELPEAITKVPPVYPDEARKQGIAGIVTVQALVGNDGHVKETRVVKSIPGLDEAAAAAVMQWVFKPARSKGAPVAVWVAVPVKFGP